MFLTVNCNFLFYTVNQFIFVMVEVLCSVWGTDWILKCYKRQLQRINALIEVFFRHWGDILFPGWVCCASYEKNHS
jgi:hypothetical protein